LESTASFTFVEPCEQYRSTVEFRWIKFHWFNRVDQPGGPV
jgi:hypothetical protein